MDEGLLHFGHTAYIKPSTRTTAAGVRGVRVLIPKGVVKSHLKPYLKVLTNKALGLSWKSALKAREDAPRFCDGAVDEEYTTHLYERPVRRPAS